jgi:hypothetical protein
MHEVLIFLIGTYCGWIACRIWRPALAVKADKAGKWLVETRFMRRFSIGSLYMKHGRDT